MLTQAQLKEEVGMEVREGNPPINGMYVAYVDPDMRIPFAKKMLLMWIDGQWGYPGSFAHYRGPVYGYIGPLPAMRLIDQEV